MLTTCRLHLRHLYYPRPSVILIKISVYFESLEISTYLYTMKLSDAKSQFIASWGAFGTQWGINRTMAQIHALLLVSADPLSADDIMEQLDISRGNANMNVRELINWGLVERIIMSGERKEFFVADKDIWRIAKQIAKERKKRELDPMIKMLDQLSNVEGDKRDKEVKTFTDTLANIKKFGLQADKALDMMIKADENWLLGSLIKMLK
jgi:DNA-binding transcriptional regulator GbsR (MarR family)